MRLLKIITFVGLLLFILNPWVHGQGIKTVGTFGYALVLYDRGLYEIAIDEFKRFQFNNPDDPKNAEAQFYIGKSYMAAEEYEKAKRAFEEFVLLYRESPLYSNVFSLFAECYERLGEPKKAAETFESIADILFADTRYAVPALYRAAEIYVSIGNIEKAYGLLLRLIDIYPEHQLYPKAVILLSNLYAENGEYIKAIRELRKIETSDVGDIAKWEAAYFRGIYELKVNQITRGEEALQSILRSAPADSSIHQETILVLAGHYQAVNKYDEAERVLERLINISRALPHLKGQAYMLLGINHYARNNYREAERAFQQALELLDSSSPAYRECLYHTGLNYVKLEDNNRAFSFLSRMFTPEWLDTVGGSDIALYEIDAFKLYLSTVSLTSEPIDITLYSNAILEKSEMFADAETFLQWGDLFYESSIPRTAKEIYEKGIPKFPESKGSDFLLLNLGKTYELLGEYRTASEFYAKVRNNYPGGEAAHLAAERSDYVDRKFSLLSISEEVQKQNQLLSQLSQIITEPEQIQIIAFLRGEHQFELREIKKALENFSTIIEAGAAGQYYTDALKYTAQLHDDLFHIYSFEGDRILKDREGKDALNYYIMYLEHSESGDFSGIARRRVFDLTLELIENPEKKVQRARMLVQSLRDERRRDAEEYGQYRLAKLIITYKDSVNAVREAVDMLSRLNIDSFDKPIQEDILYLQVAAGQKLLDNTRIIQSCSRYMSDYPRGSNTPEVRYRGAKALFNTGDASTAKLWIDQLQSDFYYSAYADSAYVLLADILLKEGNTEDALLFYQNTVRSISSYENPGLLASLLWKMGNTYAEMRDFVNAADHYRIYIAINNDIDKKAQGYRALAKVYESQDSLNAAIEAYREIISLDPDPVQTFDAEVEIAYLLFQLCDPMKPGLNEKLQTARDAFLESAAKPSPDTTRARLEFYALSCLYNRDRRQEANEERGDFENRYKNLPKELLDEYKGLLRVEEGAVHQRTALSLQITANQREMDNRFEEAESIFNDVIKKYPGGKAQQLAEYYLGLQMIAQNRFDEGMPLLTNFHIKYPDSPYIYMVSKQLGTIHNNFYNYKDAFAAFDRAVNTPYGKNDMQTHLNYITSCENAGFFDSQLKAIRTYLNHFLNASDRISKLRKIGLLYIDLGQYDAAVAHLKSILPRADPGEQIEIQYYIGESFSAQKKYTLAIAEYLKILEYGDPSSIEQPFFTNARWHIAQSFKEIGEYNNAITYLDKIIKSYGPTDPFYKSASREKELILNLMKIKK